MIRSRTSILALVALLALDALFPSQPVYAAGFTVTRTDDPVPNGCNASDCSLREAVIAANIAAGPDTITLPADTFTLGIAGQGEDAAATGDLDVSSDITLSGAAAATTIIEAGTTSSNGIDRVFDVFAGATLSVTGVTVQHGRSANGEVGGGIRSKGTLTVANSIVSSNSAATGAGIHSTGALALVNSVISNNQAAFTGGGLVTLGTATITKSAISTNQSGGSSGGIDAGGTVLLDSSTVSGNQANDVGGGISTLSTVTSINSTISNNSTKASGGGIMAGGTVTLINTTIANNVADSDANGTGTGGGVRFFGTNTMTLRNTLIGNNTKGADTTVKSDCSTTKPLTSQGYNLIEDVTDCGITGDITGNITGKDPRLGTLKDNGGPTQTQALLPAFQTPPIGGLPPINLPASPAIDAGDPAGCTAGDGTPLSTDQRGIARPQGAHCDIGAFELEVAAPPSNNVYVPLVVK